MNTFMLFVMQTVATYIHMSWCLFRKHTVANLIKDIIQRFKTMSKLCWSLDNFKGHRCTSESNAAVSMPHTSQHNSRWMIVKRWTPDMPCDAGILKCCTYQDINICSLAGIMSLAEVVCVWRFSWELQTSIWNLRFHSAESEDCLLEYKHSVSKNISTNTAEKHTASFISSSSH